MSIPALRQLRLLLAMLLCLQSGLAMARCLRLAGDVAQLPALGMICTSDGLVALAMAEPPQAPASAEPGFCVACHLPGGATLDVPPALPAPRLVLVAAALPPCAAPPPPASRPPPYRPTGPPIHG